MAKFRLKEDESEKIEVIREEIQEIIPDADFRFSLIILKTGDKHFVYGTEDEIWKELETGIN